MIDSPPPFIIVHTSDEHSYARGEPAGGPLYTLSRELGNTSLSQGDLVGGFARRIECIERVRQANLPTLVLSSGDFLEGDLWFRAFKGSVDVSLMNEVGYDAITVGNHDLVYGWEFLQNLLKQAKFRVLSANLFTKDSTGTLVPILPSHHIFEIGQGRRVAVIGVLGMSAYNSIAPDQRKNLYIEDPVKALEKLLQDPSIRSCDQILLLSHSGIEEDRKIASQFPEITAILGGHSHTLMAKPEMVGKVPVMHPYCNGQIITKLFFDAQGISPSIEILDQRFDPSIDKAKRVDAWIQSKTSEVEKMYEQAVAECQESFSLEGKKDRLIPIGEELSNILRSVANADVGFVLSGSIRGEGFKKGQSISLGQFFKICPLDNPVMKIKANGAFLQEMMQRGHKRWGGANAQFQFGGITVTPKEDGSLQCQVGREPLNPERWYTIVSTEYFFQREIMDRDLQISPQFLNDGKEGRSAVDPNFEILPDPFTQSILKGIAQGLSTVFIPAEYREMLPSEAV